MDIFKIVAIAIVSVAAALVLKGQRPEMSMMVTITAGVVIFLGVVVAMFPVFVKLNTLFEYIVFDGEYLEVLIKALGVSFISQFASDICTDAGESALAGKIEFAGKVSVLIVGLPLITKLIDIIIALIV